MADKYIKQEPERIFNIIVSLLEEAAEKIIHLDLFLKSLKSISPPEERELIKFFEKEVERLKIGIYRSIRSFLIKPKDKVIQEDFIKNSLEEFFSACNGIITIQDEIDTFVSLPKLPTEIYTTIQSVFSRSSLAKIRVDPTILYTHSNIPSFTKISSRIIEPTRTILVIPYIDFSNPIMWAYLFHEMGHAVQRHEEEADIPKLVLEVVEYLKAQKKLIPEYNDLSEQAELLQNYIGELISDRIALKLMGPAFLNSFVLWLLTWSPNEFPDYYLPSEKHPSPEHRIKLMNAFFQNERLDTSLSQQYTDLFFFVTNQTKIHLSKASLIQHICPVCKTEEDEFGIPPLPIIQRGTAEQDNLLLQLEDIIEAITQVFKKIDFLPVSKNYIPTSDPFKSLIKTLSENIPIPSRRRKSDSNQSICQKTSEIIKFRDAEFSQEDFREKFDEILDLLCEEPNDVADILNAGWQIKASGHFSRFEDIFNKKEFSVTECFDAFSKYIDAFNHRLLKSIEIANIHSLWVKGKANAKI